jgi:hypothetical protein
MLCEVFYEGNFMSWARYILIGFMATGLTACVKLQAPDKPIEINLNINIKQEVVIKLEKDVQDLIKRNPGVF